MHRCSARSVGLSYVMQSFEPMRQESDNASSSGLVEDGAIADNDNYSVSEDIPATIPSSELLLSLGTASAESILSNFRMSQAALGQSAMLNQNLVWVMVCRMKWKNAWVYRRILRGKRSMYAETVDSDCEANMLDSSL